MELSDLKGRKAISYARWSSGRQSKGSSSERQSKMAEVFAERYGLTLESKIVDNGVSAYTGDNLNEGLGRFLDGITNGDIPTDTVLLIENMDRFSRQKPVKAVPKFLDVLSTGLTIVTLRDQAIHTYDRYDREPTALLQSLLMMQMAHEESRQKGDRIKASWDTRLSRIAQGQKLSISKLPFWIDRTTNGLNERAKDANRLFEIAMEGNGASNVTRMLNAEGIVAPRGSGTWGRSVVQDILKSRAAYGSLVIRGEEHRDYFPAIISEDNWLALQNRAQRQRKNPQASTNANLFSRLLKCGGCGGPISVSSYKEYRYARCDNQVHKRLECDAGSWPYNELEELVVSNLGAILSVPGKPLEAPAEAVAIAEQLESLRSRQQRARDMGMDAETADNIAYFRQLADDLSRQIDGLSKKLSEVHAKRAARVLAGQVADDIQEAWEAAQEMRTSDRRQLQAMIAAVVDQIKLEPFDPEEEFNVAVVHLKTRSEPHNLILEHYRLKRRRKYTRKARTVVTPKSSDR
ncbi:recombinase family protein [Rhizobium sp. R86522]|uniref:recombinase family protein n=1 Tax=Rhizobium sp. R86522 TaxID=3093861 RepID=UPI003670A44C